MQREVMQPYQAILIPLKVICNQVNRRKYAVPGIHLDDNGISQEFLSERIYIDIGERNTESERVIQRKLTKEDQCK